jgi:hypothetical protein
VFSRWHSLEGAFCSARRELLRAPADLFGRTGAAPIVVGLIPPSVFQEPAIQHERSGPRRVLTQALEPEPQVGGAPALQPSSLLEEVFLQPNSALQTQATDSDSDSDDAGETDSSPKEVFLQPSADLRMQSTESDSDADSAAEAGDDAAAIAEAAGVDPELVKALQAAVRLRPGHADCDCHREAGGLPFWTEMWSVQGLSDHVSVLREVGVETLADIRYLDEVRDCAFSRYVLRRDQSPSCGQGSSS